MNEELKAKILDILNSHYFMTLATIRVDGFPQVTAVHYINDDFTIYFATDSTSQKTANIKLHNKVAAAIIAESRDAYKLRALSFSGIAERVLQSDRAHEIKLRLFRKLPNVRRFAPGNEKQLAVFAIAPVAISLVDYASGYGNTHLLEL